MVTTLNVPGLMAQLFVKLKELEDFHWFPAILRKYQMELIGIMVSFFGFYRHIALTIKKDIRRHDIGFVTDLCSGSGYPAVYVYNQLNMPHIKMTLTDKFPQQVALTPGIEYPDSPLDIRDVEPDQGTYYTLFNAFHHFEKREQQQLIQKILDRNSHLMIVEIVQPTLLNVILVTLASTLGVWLLCPFVRPFEFKRIVLTYLLPVNVLTVLIDGFISILKSRSVHQYKKDMIEMFGNTDRIQVNSQWSFPTRLVTIKVLPNHV
ncbi:MAG: hypothetical protein IPN79_17170 [Saprospiraceae bacterium]|nr:hypothetical protein [Saprospiraceae bacterium]